LPPAPAERAPTAQQAGRRPPVAESEKPHKIRLITPSIGNRGAILHNGKRLKIQKVRIGVLGSADGQSGKIRFFNKLKLKEKCRLNSTTAPESSL
jgi:hypothetical protein